MSVRIKLKDWRGFMLIVVAGSVVVFGFSVANTVTGYRAHCIVPAVAASVSNDSDHLVVAHYDVDGRAYELRQTTSGKGVPRTGDRLYVRYQISSPQIAQLVGVSAPWMEMMAAWFAGTAIILVYAYLCFVSVTERTHAKGSQKSAEPV